MAQYQALVDPKNYETACADIRDSGLKILNEDDEKVAIIFEGDEADADAVRTITTVESVDEIGKTDDAEYPEVGSNESFAVR